MTQKTQATWFLLGLNKSEFQSLLPRHFCKTMKAQLSDITPETSSLSGEEWLLQHQFGLEWPLPYGGLMTSSLSDEYDYVVGQWVYLKADQRQVFMMNGHDLQIADQDSQALIKDVNELIAGEPFKLKVDDQGSIYSANPHAVAMPERSPTSVMNTSIFDELKPLGHNAWAKAFSEIQMLLYNHPVNIERQKQGLLPINALWLWGSSHQPELPQKPAFSAICSDQLFWQRVAHWARLNYQPLSSNRVRHGQLATLFVIQQSDTIRQLMGDNAFWQGVLTLKRPIYFLLQDGHQYKVQRLPWWRRWLSRWSSYDSN